jgi:prepilin-type N-terminal cleavage/methylation domain-containing protein
VISKLKATQGFSLLEVVAVVILLAIIAAITLPRLIKRRVPVRQQLLQQLNHLSRTAQLNAMMTGKLHRVIFDPKNDRVNIEMESDKRDSQGAIQWNPLKIPYVKTSVQLPKNVEIDRFLIKGKNMVRQGEGIQLTGAWFYIIPEGMVQEVTIGFRDRDTLRAFSYSINPFTAVFNLL